MRLIFLGSPDFALPSLKALDAHPKLDVVLVVTQPDRPAGRGRKPLAPPVKDAAEHLCLPVYQPESLRTKEGSERLREAEADMMVVVSYGEILRTSVLELTKHGCLNVHPSLLPRYRGATPIPAAILNGDSKTGVTIMRLVPKLDAGPIIARETIPLDGTETTGSLTSTLAELAARMLPHVIIRWGTGQLEESDQEHDRATYTRQLRKSDAQIDWREPAIMIERFVRAMDPWPGAWSEFGNRRIIVRSVRVGESSTHSSVPGTVTSSERAVYVATGAGVIELLSVQPAGKSPMSASDWARGLQGRPCHVLQSPDTPRQPLIFSH